MAETMNMPAGFGGLTRFKEEYDSRFKFSPAVVIGMIIATVVLIIALNLIFPLSG